MTVNVILDFCGSCGVLTDEGFGNQENQHCINCGVDLTEDETRITGIFSKEAATRLCKVFGQEINIPTQSEAEQRLRQEEPDFS